MGRPADTVSPAAMKNVATVTVCGCAVAISEHAAERYYERCRPGLASIEDALEDLVRIAGAHGHFGREPEWIPLERPEHDSTTWLLLGTDVALPCAITSSRRIVATTTLTRGSLADSRRQRRSERRARLTEQRKSMRAGRSADRKVSVGRRGAGSRKAQRGGLSREERERRAREEPRRAA